MAFAFFVINTNQTRLSKEKKNEPENFSTTIYGLDG